MFVGQREQISSTHQPGVQGCSPKPHSCLQMRLQLGRGTWGLWPRLWGLCTLDPTRLASGLPSPGCWLCPWPGFQLPADTWALPLAGRVAWTTALRGKSQGLGFGPTSSPFPSVSDLLRRPSPLQAISLLPCRVLPTEAHLCLIHQPAFPFFPGEAAQSTPSPEDSRSRDLGPERGAPGKGPIAGVCSRGRGRRWPWPGEWILESDTSRPLFCCSWSCAGRWNFPRTPHLNSRMSLLGA